jgi:hypothetical protein
MLIRRIAGAVLVLMGGVWFLQGLGVIQSDSFMTDDPLWVLIGAVTVIAGIALIAWRRRSTDS